MMRTMRTAFKPTALSVALLMAFGSAIADEAVDELAKPDSSVSVGLGHWSNDRPQQGIYDAMRDSGAYGLIDADIVKRDDSTGTWLRFNARDLGLDNREMRGDYIRQGEFGGFLEYGKTTSDSPYRINTGLQGIGTTNLTVGTSLGSFAKRDVHLGTEREQIRLGGFRTIAPGLELKIDFKNEKKTGTRQTGWGSATLFSVEPIDSTIRQLETMLQYTGARLQLSGGYYGSWYENDNPLILQRLNGVTGGTSASFNSITPLSQPMSNQAHQVFLDGGYSFTPTTRGTFKLAYTRATQDEHLPTHDLTGANAPFVNAPASLNGKVNTTLMQLGLSSRPMPKLLISGNLRYYDVDDKTPLRGFVGSNTTGIATVFNTPQSFTTTSGKIEATYRLPMNFSVTGGIDHLIQDRSYPTVGNVFVPFRADIKETTYRVQVRRSLGDNLNGALAYLRSERDGSDYIAANGSAPYSNQINPIHIADRERDKVRASLDWEPAENISLQFRIDHAQDKYPSNGRPYGPRDGSYQLYAIDASYLISDDWKFAAWYSRDLTKARRTNPRAANGGPFEAFKDTDIKDVGDSFGVSLRGRLTAKIEAGFGVDWFASTSSYDQQLTGPNTTFPANTVAGVPDVKNKLLRLKLDGKYVIDKASEVRFDLIHERWKTDDWSWNFANGSPFAFFNGNIGCTGCSVTPVNVVDGTTVNARQTQSSNFVGVRYIYRFH